MKALVGFLVKDNIKVYLQCIFADSQDGLKAFWHEQQSHAKGLTDDEVCSIIELLPYLNSVNNCYFITLPDDFVQAPYEVVYLN